MNSGIKRERQRAIRELVAHGFVGSQEELASALRDRGFGVTQATISRDITELGLVRIARGDRHLYLTPEEVASGRPAPSDDRLKRVLAEESYRVGRSGLTLLLVGSPGTANSLGQAIDESTLDEQEGTLAGDNTLLVLFADEERLERWLDRFLALGGRVHVPPRIRGRRPPLTALPRPTPALTEARS